jgi:hypothetical protein
MKKVQAPRAGEQRCARWHGISQQAASAYFIPSPTKTQYQPATTTHPDCYRINHPATWSAEDNGKGRTKQAHRKKATAGVAAVLPVSANVRGGVNKTAQGFVGPCCTWTQLHAHINEHNVPQTIRLHHSDPTPNIMFLDMPNPTWRPYPTWLC